MESRVRLLILCLVCVARASKVLPEEIAEFKAGSLAYRSIENLSRASAQKTDEVDGQTTDKLRDKRALGLLLSGLAQIFGYTVTPIQIASLPNPNTTKPVAMSNSSMTGTMGPQTAASRPVNVTVPKQQETIRFTGVVNFGNNSDIIGHLQRYEQIFHGRPNNTMIMKMMNMRPLPMPKPPAKISVDLRTNMQDKPPLLAPFFVKIPLPIAPELLSTAIPVEDIGLSHSDPSLLLVNESNEEETPVRKEQETIYRNNEETERYTVEEKDIHDEKDVRKPMSKFNHQLYIEEPTRKKQQEDRYNQLQREQAKHVERLKEQEERRNHDKDARYEEDEINEKHRNREKEIANRNREYTSKDESVEEKRPHDEDVEDEDSAEKERVPANLSKSSRQPLREKTEKEEIEDYPNYDDDSNKQLNRQPENFNKYIEVEYNQQLPIGDYFHENNPEVIRDSYGEVLNNKKLEDDRLASYITMFKHPYVTNVYDSPNIQHPEDALREDTKAVDGYKEHLARLQKLREEYALPENKYEEYDINDEREADRDDRESDKIRNDASGKSERPKTEHLRGKEEDRSAKTPIGSNRNEVLRKDDAKFEKAKSQKEVDFAEYMPLVVPIRYIDTNDKMKQETVQQLNYKKLNKSNNQLSKDPTRTVPTERVTSQVIGFPEKPRQLHEGKHRDLHIWPPPFDYVFDNTEPVNTIIPSNPQGYAPNYYQHVKNIPENDANNDNVSEQPSGYLVVVGNPVQPYRNPYNIYYVPNEAAISENQVPHLNAKGTHSRDQIYASQQNAQQQFIQIRPNLTEYNLNETKGPHNYYYQTQEIPPNVLNRYRYIFEERTLQPKELLNVDARSQIPDTENWSSKIYPLQSRGETNEQSLPIRAQNVASLNQKLRSRPSERPRYPQRLRKRKRSQSEDQRKNDDKAETPQPAPKNKPFDDPQSAHDFFGFSKDDYNFGSESSDASQVSEENGKTTGESDVFDAPEPVAYHHDDESIMKHTDELENDSEKAKVKEYRNKVATLRVSEQRQLKPNGPIHYVDYEKREEIQRRNELENKMAEILENLKTRLLVE